MPRSSKADSLLPTSVTTGGRVLAWATKADARRGFEEASSIFIPLPFLLAATRASSNDAVLPIDARPWRRQSGEREDVMIPVGMLGLWLEFQTLCAHPPPPCGFLPADGPENTLDALVGGRERAEASATAVAP